MKKTDPILSALIPTATVADQKVLASILSDMPMGVLSTLAAAGCVIRPLAKGERFRAASRALARLGVDVDAWPAPPAGLFVVEERTVYIRSRSAMTIGHETFHALDCALGKGVYLSGADVNIRRMFTGARRFVTPYAATGCDEWFAECARAYASHGRSDFNDTSSHWPRATRERLRRVDPDAHAYFESLFAELATSATQPLQLEMPLSVRVDDATDAAA